MFFGSVGEVKSTRFGGKTGQSAWAGLVFMGLGEWMGVGMARATTQSGWQQLLGVVAGGRELSDDRICAWRETDERFSS